MTKPKPKWESSPTIPAPPPDEIDVEVDTEPMRPSVEIEQDEYEAGNQDWSWEQRVLSELSNLRREQREDRKLLHRVARSIERLATQSTQTANVAQILVCDKETRNGMGELVVLLVEDDEDVLAAMERMLIRAGAATLRARDAAEAREQLRRLGDGRLDAVIIDFILPDGDGVSLCREIRRKRPQARMIAHTGADDGSIPPGLFHAILNKPSTGAQVRDALMKQVAAE